MRKLATPSLRLFAVVCGLLLLPMSAGAQGPLFNPTHYWTYHILQPYFAPQPIRVADQFFRQPVPVTVDSLDRFLNWVRKNDSAVPDTFLHYTWWNIHEKLPVNRDVIVTNQFGSYPVKVLNLEFLLAPASKNQPTAPPGPPDGDHFLCYRAVGFPPPPNGYHLQDEWRQDFQYPRPLEYLCAPCFKEHLGRIFAPLDTLTHLAVYPITPTSDYFYPFVSDQFQRQPLFVQQFPLEYLFVPSLKEDFPTDVKKSTWGRMKQLYR